MLRWITNVFRRLIGGGESPPPTPSPPQQRSPRLPVSDSQSSATKHVDYYDNKYREEAAEEDRLMRECFEKASEARQHHNYDSADKYVKQVNPVRVSGRIERNPAGLWKDLVDLNLISCKILAILGLMSYRTWKLLSCVVLLGYKSCLILVIGLKVLMYVHVQ